MLATVTIQGQVLTMFTYHVIPSVFFTKHKYVINLTIRNDMLQKDWGEATPTQFVRQSEDEL